MALDSTGPKDEITRVCRLMEELPQNYFSVNGAGLAQAMHGHSPIHAHPMPLGECAAAFPNIQRSLVWRCKGCWQDYSEALKEARP